MKAVDPRPLIAHVVFRFDVGGLENGVVNLINRMPHHRWRHAVVALDRISPSFSRRVQRQDVQYAELAKPPGHLVWQYPRLLTLIGRLQPAIVHTRNLAALEATVPAWLARVPVRIHGEHGWDVNDLQGADTKQRWIRRVYRPFVSSYVALSRHLANYLTMHVGVPTDAVSHICNGVDTVRFRPADGGRGRVEGSPFSSPTDWLVGTVGRLAAVKDQVNLARAFVLARELDPAAFKHMRLVIVGDGPLREAVLEVLRSHGAADRAWFAGERGDIPEIMRGLDAFVLPSLAEGISNTILEAMASGLPIVATDVGGNRELIEEGVTGRLVAPADPYRLADAILEDFRDRGRARRHSVAAREAAERKFSLDRMVGDYCALYERELTRAGRTLIASEPVQPLS
jgi:sugar transferase (PEP-CTERM/EpsH1 system associated)